VFDNERVVHILLANGELETVKITLGASSDMYSEVIAGDLEVGDVIVLNPPSSIFSPGGDMGPGRGGPFQGGGS